MTAGNTQVTVSFTASKSDVGGSAITGYSVVVSDGQQPVAHTATGTHHHHMLTVHPKRLTKLGFMQSLTERHFIRLRVRSISEFIGESVATAWDLSTSVLRKQGCKPVWQPYPQDWFVIGNGGSTLYGVNLISTAGIYQYPLSTAYDVSNNG